MSNLHQPQGNPVQEQGDAQQQQQQSSPDARPQADDEELENADHPEPLPGDAPPEADDEDHPDKLRQTQANQQSDAVPEEGDIYRGEPKSDNSPDDSASR